MELVGPDQALDKIKQLEKYFNEKNLPIIYVQHIHEVTLVDMR
jgi:isochorismate hydrolase